MNPSAFAVDAGVAVLALDRDGRRMAFLHFGPPWTHGRPPSARERVFRGRPEERCKILGSTAEFSIHFSMAFHAACRDWMPGNAELY